MQTDRKKEKTFQYDKNKFKRKSLDDIRTMIISMGFQPVLVTNTAGYEYPPNEHYSTKLLAIIDGGISITIENDVIQCDEGDLIIITCGTLHSAIVGKYGCRFYWSEKL